MNYRVMTGVRFVVVALLVFSCGSAEEKMMRFYKRGKYFYTQNELIKARKELKNAVQIDPKFARGFYYLGLVERKANNYQKAFSYFSTAVQLDSKLMDAQVALGKLFMSTKDVKRALEKAELVLSRIPEHVDATLLKATVYLHQQKKDEVYALLNGLLKKERRDSEIYLLWALTALQEKNLAKAIEILEKGVVVNPDSVKLYTLLSGVQAGAGNFKAAEIAMNKIIALEPKNIGYQWKFVDLLWQAGQQKKAQDKQKEIINRHPNDEQQWLHATQFYLSHNHDQLAEHVLKTGIVTIPDTFKLRFALSEIYMQRHQVDDAIATLNTCLSLKGEDASQKVQAKNLLARALMANGESDKAETVVNEILNANPKNIDAHYAKGQLFMLRRSGADAVAEFGTVVQDRPEIVEGYLRLAEAHLLNKENKRALDVLISASRDFLPRSKKIHQAIAQMYMIQKDYDSAEKKYNQILALNPQDYGTRIELSDLFVNTNRFDDAEAQYLKVIEQFSQNEMAYIHLSQLYCKMKRFDQAALVLSKGINAVPDSIQLVTHLVNHYLARGQFDDAIVVCKKQLKKKSKAELLYNLIGVIYMAQKEYDIAKRNLNRAVELNPLWPMPYRNLARLALAQGQITDAISKLNLSLTVNPRNPGAYLALGKLYEQNDSYNDAVQVYEKALSVYPNMWAAANNLAFLLCENARTSADLKRASRWGRKVAKMRPNDPVVLDTLAWIAFKQGKMEQAKQILEDALEKVPEHPELNYHMGAILAKSGQVIEARRKLILALAGNVPFHGRQEAQILWTQINQ